MYSGLYSKQIHEYSLLPPPIFECIYHYREGQVACWVFLNRIFFWLGRGEMAYTVYMSGGGGGGGGSWEKHLTGCFHC